MINFTLFFFMVFSQLDASAANPPYSKKVECAEAQAEFEYRFTRLQRKYQTLNRSRVSEENSPTWNWGRKKQAVYLLHGFIGTPEEFSALAKKLSLQNYTVINDLIPGHGTNGFVANQFNYKLWQNHVEANLNSIRTCFDKIHLVGFSTGALLIHDYVRTHAPSFAANSFTLFSPFYKSHSAFAEFLRTAARFITPVILTKPLYYLTRFPDIKVAVLKPENYLQQLPLDAAHFVLEFGAQVDNDIKSSALSDETTPTLLFVSKTDRIMNIDATLKNMTADFQNLTIQRFDGDDVPHHLMVDVVSSVAESVQDQTVEFILTHSN